jgi:hypothetical protein
VIRLDRLSQTNLHIHRDFNYTQFNDATDRRRRLLHDAEGRGGSAQRLPTYLNGTRRALLQCNLMFLRFDRAVEASVVSKPHR